KRIPRRAANPSGLNRRFHQSGRLGEESSTTTEDSVLGSVMICVLDSITMRSGGAPEEPLGTKRFVRTQVASPGVRLLSCHWTYLQDVAPESLLSRKHYTGFVRLYWPLNTPKDAEKRFQALPPLSCLAVKATAG